MGAVRAGRPLLPVSVVCCKGTLVWESQPAPPPWLFTRWPCPGAALLGRHSGVRHTNLSSSSAQAVLFPPKLARALVPVAPADRVILQVLQKQSVRSCSSPESSLVVPLPVASPPPGAGVSGVRNPVTCNGSHVKTVTQLHFDPPVVPGFGAASEPVGVRKWSQRFCLSKRNAAEGAVE